MFKKPLGLLGVFLMIVGIGYFVGAGVAYSKTQGGYDSLSAFSRAQNVTLSYNDEGQLIDRGEVAGAQAIMKLLKEDWDFPVVMGKGGLDPKDPVVNNQSEYMFQMATIVHHTLAGEQKIVVTQEQIDAAKTAAVEAENGLSGGVNKDGIYNGAVEAYKGKALTPGTYTVPVNGRYWTAFNRTDILDGKAREQAWSGTAHALVGELGVGAATHSALQLALGIAGLLAGLGVVCEVMGAAFLWHTAQTRKLFKAPDTIPVEMVKEITNA